MNMKKPLLRFNGPKFREYVKSAPRNYSMVVMLTALAPSRQCQICRHAHDEFAIVANSYRFSSIYSNKLFFAMVDFDEGSEVFQLLRLNTAPVFMHFPAKGKPKGADTMDIHRVGFAADSIAKFVAERTDITIRIFRPPNYSGTVAMITLLALAGSFLYIRRNNLEFLYNKNLWGAIAVFFCFAMISGQMWNHIRGPPLVHKSQNGGVAYIHGSSQGQLVVETYIVMFLSMFRALKPSREPLIEYVFFYRRHDCAGHDSPYRIGNTKEPQQEPNNGHDGTGATHRLFLLPALGIPLQGAGLSL